MSFSEIKLALHIGTDTLSRILKANGLMRTTVVSADAISEQESALLAAYVESGRSGAAERFERFLREDNGQSTSQRPISIHKYPPDAFPSVETVLNYRTSATPHRGVISCLRYSSTNRSESKTLYFWYGPWRNDAGDAHADAMDEMKRAGRPIRGHQFEPPVSAVGCGAPKCPAALFQAVHRRDDHETSRTFSTKAVLAQVGPRPTDELLNAHEGAG